MRPFFPQFVVALALHAQPRTAFEAVSIKVHPEPIIVSSESTSGTIAIF